MDKSKDLPKLTKEEMELALARAKWFRDVNKGKIDSDITLGLKLMLSKDFEQVLAVVVQVFQTKKAKGVDVLKEYKFNG